MPGHFENHVLTSRLLRLSKWAKLGLDGGSEGFRCEMLYRNKFIENHNSMNTVERFAMHEGSVPV